MQHSYGMIYNTKENSVLPQNSMPWYKALGDTFGFLAGGQCSVHLRTTNYAASEASQVHNKARPQTQRHIELIAT